MLTTPSEEKLQCGADSFAPEQCWLLAGCSVMACCVSLGECKLLVSRRHPADCKPLAGCNLQVGRSALVACSLPAMDWATLAS
mmetsp:Transcript_87200/g.282356  ORF Transcript_87200/g.282356 Transcript_87200/m.282356 type:complete len:83 (-) Transcript_87200:686-934(-)